MLSLFSIFFYFAFPALFVIFSYKGYKRLGGFFLLMPCGYMMLGFTSEAATWWPILLAESVILVIGSFGVQLRYAGAKAWKLFFKALMSDVSKLSGDELLTVYRFHIYLKKSFWQFTQLLCFTTLVVTSFDVIGRLHDLNVLQAIAIRGLLPLLFPVILAFFITQIVLVLIHGKIIKYIPLDHNLREDDIGVPRWIWMMPILALFMVLLPNLHAILGNIPLRIQEIIKDTAIF